MSPLTEDDTIRRIDQILEPAGFTRDRMHVTGKRRDNYPDLLVYSKDSARDSLTVGLSDSETATGAHTSVDVTYVGGATRSWDSFEDFEKDITPWIQEHQG